MTDNIIDQDFRNMVHEKIEQLLEEREIEEINNIFIEAEKLTKKRLKYENKESSIKSIFDEDDQDSDSINEIEKQLTEEEMNDLFEKAENIVEKLIKKEKIDSVIKKYMVA